MIDKVVGNFRVIEKIGGGGMGTVYLAKHVLTGQRAAMKVLHSRLSDEREYVMRFFNEAKAADQIRHPGIVKIFDVGTHEDGHIFIVMEYLEGADLARLIRGRRRLPVGRSMLIARQVTQALEAAHAKGVVHRDLKPDNLFLVKDPRAAGGERVKILDFGIAKLMSDHGPSLHKTRTGAVLGTPTYMSPEQCRGTGRVDHRADLYSLGCIVFRLMTGRIPFLCEGYGELIAAHIHMEPPRPRSLEPAIPPSFEAVILKLLNKDPADRFQSATELLEAIDDTVANTHLGLPNVSATEKKAKSPTQEVTAVFESPHLIADPTRPRVEVSMDMLGDDRAPTDAEVEVPEKLESAIESIERDLQGDLAASTDSEGRVESRSGPDLDELNQLLESIEQSDPDDDSTAKIRSENPEELGIELEAKSRRPVQMTTKVVTTLTSAAGDLPETEAIRPRRRGSWLLAILLTLLTLAGAAAAAVYYYGYERIPFIEYFGFGDHSEAAEHESAGEVILEVASTPSGADVYRESDGVRVGKTPYKARVERTDGELVLRLKLAGYRDEVVVLPTVRDNRQSVEFKAGPKDDR